MADKFHAWQDKRAVKKFERVEAKREAKRKTAVLTHIVKELPRA